MRWIVDRVILAAALGVASFGLAPARGADLPASEYRLSGPHGHANLSIYLVHGRATDRGGAMLTLQEALKRGVARIRETGNVDQLTIENTGNEPVYVQAGDIVKGGQQDRVLRLDLVLAPRSGPIQIASFCVEQGRWAQRGGEDVRHFSSADAAIPSRDLKLAAREVAKPAPAGPVATEPVLPGSRRQQAGNRGPASAQSEVWAGVADLQRKLGGNVRGDVAAPASRTSLQLSLENDKLRAAADAYYAALVGLIDKEPDAIGFAFAIDGKINSADVYGSPALFRQMWAKLLRAASTEALAERKEGTPATPPTAEAMKAFLVASEAARPTERDLAGGGKQVTRDGDKAVVFETRRAASAPGFVHRNYLGK